MPLGHQKPDTEMAEQGMVAFDVQTPFLSLQKRGVSICISAPTRKNITPPSSADRTYRIADLENSTRESAFQILQSHEDNGNLSIYEYAADKAAGNDRNEPDPVAKCLLRVGGAASLLLSGFPSSLSALRLMMDTL